MKAQQSLPTRRRRGTLFRFDRRATGLLLHPTSLPGPHGSGDVGAEARAFADFCAAARVRWWQMLPVNPPGSPPGNSPYSSTSAFAGSPWLINLELLRDDGLLERADVQGAWGFNGTASVDFAAVLAVPNDVKVELLRYFLDRGKHVLVEKPLIIDPETASDLARRARQNGAVWHTAYNFRFEPHVTALKRHLDRNVLGRIYRVRMFYGNGTAGNLLTCAVTPLFLPWVWRTPSLEDLGIAAAAGMTAGSAFLLLAAAFRAAPAAVIAPFQYSQMLYAILVGWLLFADWPSSRMLLGSAIIVASGLYVLRQETGGLGRRRRTA